MDKDLLFKYHKESSCPTGKSNSKETSHHLIEDALFKGKEVMKKIANDLKTKLKISKDIDFKMMKVIGDSAHSDYFHQPNSPLLDMKDTLGNYVSNINAINHMSVYLDKRFIKVVLSNLLKEILKFMGDKVKDGVKHKRKFVSYSMHDTNLSPLIMYLGIVDFECNLRQVQTHEVIGCAHKPPYASSVIFELAKNSHGEHAVFFRYNGQYRDVCSGKFPPPIDKVPCTLEKLAERLKDAMMEEDTEMHEFCGMDKTEFLVQGKNKSSQESPENSSSSPKKLISKDEAISGLFTYMDTALLIFAVLILSALVYKYKRQSEERLKLLREFAAQKTK